LTDQPDLVALNIQLQPIAGSHFSRKTPTWWGYAILQLLKIVFIQDENFNTPPFTASTLIGKTHNKNLIPSEIYTIRLTSLSRTFSANLLQETKLRGKLAPNARVELDYFPFKVINIQYTNDEQNRTGNTNFEDIYNLFLVENHGFCSGKEKNHIYLEFLSPTCFKSMVDNIEFYEAIPDPKYVFLNLLRKWNFLAPTFYRLQENDIKNFEEFLGFVFIKRFDIQSEIVTIAKQAPRSGVMGKVEYLIIKDDPDMIAWLHRLAIFSYFSGVGLSTSMGLGQTQCRSKW